VRPTGLGRGGRFLAACLAGIWSLAGLGAIAMGVWLRRGVLPICLGLLAIAYGWIWMRVAVSGQRQSWPLWGWGRRKSSH